jgi:thiol-disulfide isomerase/thioredoxin
VAGPTLFRVKRRTVITTATVVVVLLAGALAVTLLTSGKGDASDAMVEYQAGHRPLAPDFTATSVTGKPITFASYRGKTVVLNFWGSWCPPCRDEAPTLEVLAQQYGPKGVDFLGDDVNDTPQNAVAFEQSVGITYPSVNDPGYAIVQDFSQVAPVSDTPTTVVIDRTGHIAGMVLGSVTYAQMTKLLNFAAVTQ